MHIKDILLLLDTEAAWRDRLDLGVALAKRHGAFVTALCLCGAPEPTIAEGFAIGADAVRAVITRFDAEVAVAVAPVAARFREKLAELGVDGAWAAPVVDPFTQDVALFARTFDLVIAGRNANNRALAEQIVLMGGTPCVMVGRVDPFARSLDRVVVGWDGSRPAKRALQDSLPILARAKAVRLVGVTGAADLPRGLGQIPILRHLERHGVEASFERVDQDRVTTGSALLREAARFRADLLVLGAYGHSLMVEALFGGATRTVLAHAELPVLISH